MLIKKYIDLKYGLWIQGHLDNKCSCDLTDGGRGLCSCGRYVEGLETPEEFLEENNDRFLNLQYGTFIRTVLGDIARIIDVDIIRTNTWFTLDREVDRTLNDEVIRTNKIKEYHILRHSNDIKDIIEIGDIVNGHKIVMIKNDKFYYGFFGNEYIHGEIEDVLPKKSYFEHSIVSK